MGRVSSKFSFNFNVLFVSKFSESLPCLDIFEELLEIVSYLTYFSPSISLNMWSLWPLMVSALEEWAIDFFESNSHPYNSSTLVYFDALLLCLLLAIGVQ